MFTKLALDAVMLLLFLTAFAHGFSGNTAHEWIGLTVFACLAVHNVLNWRWYRTVLFVRAKGMTLRWAVSTAVTLLLVGVCVVLVASSVVHSRSLFVFLPLEQSLSTRQWHTVAAYWCLVLGAVHGGMHWPTLRGTVQKLCGISGTGRLHSLVLRALMVPIVVYGILFSCNRQMGAKLMGLASFDYWDFEQDVAGFFIGYLCIVGLYACVGHVSMLCLQRRHPNNKG